MQKRTAILVDGSFFLKRYRSIHKVKDLDPKKTANDLWEMCLKPLVSGTNFDEPFSC